MTKISNRFFVTAISDGTTVSAVLRSDKTLSQVYSQEAGTSIPDWNLPANQPTVFAVVRVNGTYRVPYLAGAKWSYNGQEILFDPVTNKSTNFLDGVEPIFERTTYVIDEIVGTVTNHWTMPALKILRNLAHVGNTDQDTITLDNSVEVGGTLIDFTVSVPVRISNMSSSGYYGYVEGDSYVNSPNPTDPGYTATMNAKLLIGDQPVQQFKTKWYREGIDTNPFASVTATSGTATTTLNASQITDYVVVRVDFFDMQNNKVFTSLWDIDDMQDTEEMFITHGTSNQNNASLRYGESTTFKIWMGRRTDQFEVDNRYTQFQVKILNSDGQTVLCSLSGNTIQIDPQGSEYVDITATDVEIRPAGSDPAVIAEKAGVVTVTYNFAHQLGDTITGIVVASGDDNSNNS